MKREELGMILWKKCRNDLYRRFPHLDGAFAGVDYRASAEIKTLGTDGDSFYFCPEYLLEGFARNPEWMRRGYLHMILHCLLLHLCPAGEVVSGRESRRQWNLACDMAVEQMIDRELGEAFLPEKRAQIRRDCLGWLGEALGNSPVSAQKAYGLLRREPIPYSMEEMEEAFSFDDHNLWRWENSALRAGTMRRKWELLGALTGQNGSELSRSAGTQAGQEKEAAGEIGKGRYDYRKFLKRFAVPREELELDEESFDYIYYTYGMGHYGNLPLIEPLEYKEGHKLEELVIAIDTSGSCSVNLVRQFLRESYSILGEKENFFKKMKVYVLQCDCVIQDAVCIRSEQEWKRYCSDLRIQGRAGTDFRPVFRYVEELREKKELRNLKALIYFTDGDGIYPREAPDYETAFVFVRKTEKRNLVPAWARRLLVEGTNFNEYKRGEAGN